MRLKEKHECNVSVLHQFSFLDIKSLTYTTVLTAGWYFSSLTSLLYPRRTAASFEPFVTKTMKKFLICSLQTGFLSVCSFVGAQSGVMKPKYPAKQLGTDRTQTNRHKVEKVAPSYVHFPVGWKYTQIAVIPGIKNRWKSHDHCCHRSNL